MYRNETEHVEELFHLPRFFPFFAPHQSECQKFPLDAFKATDMWHTAAGLLASIFMQGAFVFISYAKLRNKAFSKGTAYTGMSANGLDLIHLFVAFFAPALAAIFLSIGGVFYLLWFPLLGRELLSRGAT